MGAEPSKSGFVVHRAPQPLLQTQPQTVEVVQAQPPMVGVTHVQPQTVEVVQAQPPMVGVTHAQPPMVGVAHAQPPMVGVAHVQSPTVGVAHVQPPTVGVVPRQQLVPEQAIEVTPQQQQAQDVVQNPAGPLPVFLRGNFPKYLIDTRTQEPAQVIVIHTNNFEPQTKGGVATLVEAAPVGLADPAGRGYGYYGCPPSPPLQRLCPSPLPNRRPITYNVGY